MIAKIEAEYDTKLKDFENSIGLWEALHAAEEAEFKLHCDEHLALADLRTKTDLIHSQAYERQCSSVEEQTMIC